MNCKGEITNPTCGDSEEIPTEPCPQQSSLQRLVMLAMSSQAMGHSVVPHAVLFSISFCSPIKKHTKNSDAMLTNNFSVF